MKPQRTVRCRVERVGEAPSTRLRFTCPAGHVTIEDLNKGKPKHLRLTGSGAEQVIRWWLRNGNGAAFHCPKCFG